MPARVVVVHDDTVFTDALAEKLAPDVTSFADPIKALAALRGAKTIMFLITRVQFRNQQPLGLSLARLTRAARPDVRVIFTGRPEHMAYTRGLGEFIREPADVAHVAMIVEWLRELPDEAALVQMNAPPETTTQKVRKPRPKRGELRRSAAKTRKTIAKQAGRE
jgi:CelD/BcsL family acetyltransferase involved in cellulose biosynthesis